MSITDGVICVACGATDDLLQCASCATRLESRGIRVTVCATCANDDRKMEGVGVLIIDDSNHCVFTCYMCAVFQKRAAEDLLIATVGGALARSDSSIDRCKHVLVHQAVDGDT